MPGRNVSRIVDMSYVLLKDVRTGGHGGPPLQLFR